MKNVLIVYHYIAHYRVPIFNILSKSTTPRYTLLSGTKTEINIKTASKELAKTKVENGGLRWIFVKNYWFLNLFLIQPAVLKKSLSREYDTIIFLGVMYYPTTWLGAILAKMTNKKVIFWTHGYISNEKGFKGFLRKTFYKLADEILVYGQWAKDILISKGFSPKKIKLVYNSLDYDKQLEIRKEKTEILNLFKNNDLPTFGFIGRLTKQKNVDALIEVLYRLQKNNTKANLLIIGSGDQEELLKEKVKTYNLGEFTCFYGSSYDEKEIYQLLNYVKVVVSPGEVGLTAIHALTYGTPVITHNDFSKQMPEFEVIKSNITGDFFKHGNVTEMENVLKKWLFEKNKKDVQKDCYAIIDNFYNPYKQKEIFDSVV